jgi:hypothetical protein
MKKIVVLILVVLLIACAPGINNLKSQSREADGPAGFWLGLWHGLISFITLIISFFNKNVNIYEVYNSGWPYNIGFILGVMIAYGGGSSGVQKSVKG